MAGEEESDLASTSVVESSYGEVALLSIIKGMDHTTNSWILDSGCGCHMCYSRDAFDGYTSCKGKLIFIANNMEFKYTGMRMAKNKMFDGIVWTLTNVMYAPDLRINCISLGALDSKGCKYTVVGEVLKVAKGAMIVMKGELVKGLCTLVGSIVTGGGGATLRKNEKSVEVELEGET